MLKFFLVGIFCVTQPMNDCVRVAGTNHFQTHESCILAKQNFVSLMLQENKTNLVMVECVSAYPIELNSSI